jgi:hypothetical protein
MQSLSCRQFLSPDNIPGLCVMLNGIIAIVSCILVTLAFTGHSIALVYLEYNLTSTILWCFELGIKFETLEGGRPTLKQMAELVVAVYFMVDSGLTIYMWTTGKRESVMVGMSMRALLFAGAWVDSILYWRKKEQEYNSLELQEEGEDPWSTNFDDDEITGDFDNADAMEMI